jgi:hypothetical protein
MNRGLIKKRREGALGWSRSENSVREDIRQVAMRENQTNAKKWAVGNVLDSEEEGIQRGNHGSCAKGTRWS